MTGSPIFAEQLMKITVLSLGSVYNWISGIKIQIWDKTLLLAIEEIVLFDLFPTEVEEGQLFFHKSKWVSSDG